MSGVLTRGGVVGVAMIVMVMVGVGGSWAQSDWIAVRPAVIGH